MEKKFKNEYFNENMDENIILKREGFQKTVAVFIKNMPKNAKILDVGCGKGTYLKKIHEIRPDVELYGVDIGNVTEFMPNYINFTLCSGDNMPFENERFDFIFCFHVLEHILNPYDFMMEFNRVLKKDGLIYIEMPYYKTAYIPDGGINFWSDPTHIRPYNYRSVERLLIENGFDIFKIKVTRNWNSVFLGPYLILKRVLFNDMDALSTFFAQLYGSAIGGLGKKIKNIK
ncbi:class I SAM-dependent methyltransferase [Methanococcus maripaludis]|uniref:Putative methyltransferase n=1 Tax=Methanococcus maripaludis OS7 TaxID=637915 RepID=A0A2Z5PHV1_METMI|nr:class I SAM-dependent methyltransferase [Methanococcus maripaludis]BAP63280.1 putative methyltransferase [Methanococcus maripaludis OS7]